MTSWSGEGGGCDAVNDCDDGSDEDPTLCANSTLICAEPALFRCDNGACVAAYQLCNGEDNCGDFSDERTCGVNECDQEVKLCAHKCVDKKVGYDCVCNPGFKVNQKDKHLCEDIDECEQRPCSQMCRNTFGSYKCFCHPGYIQKDKNTCKADHPDPVKLIFSNRYYIREVDLSGHMTILAHNQSNAVALDYDLESKCFFWSDVTSLVSAIKRHCLASNHTEVIAQTVLQNPDGLAVDWVGKNLYWCDKGLDTIEVAKLDGRFRRALITSGLQEPRAIVLDPRQRFLYWTDWGERPHIGKAGMDGSSPRVLVEENLGWPNALTISFETNELFWGDAREDYIVVADLDGKRRRTILSRLTNPSLKLHHIFAIAVWEDRIFWTDWETRAVESCHKYRGDNCSTLVTTIHRPMDIRVFHPYRQWRMDNPCDAANCSTLCVLSPDPPGYRCLCPNDFVLNADNRTCTANCTSAQFICRSTYKCIPFFWKCDTQDDCGDGSDEPDHCPNFNCEPGQFQCKNHKCVNAESLCNGADDCGDNSDEADCDDYVCLATHFKCGKSANRSAHCIDASKRCDGVKNCPNSDDELNCPVKNCTSNQFPCDNGQCITKVWVCDGDTDCTDKSDERECERRDCPGNEYKCSSGRCIPFSWKCDGESDCPLNEDEKDCDAPSTCDPTYFRCKNTKCIPGRWHCDYENDCGDGSDEVGCTYRNCSESEHRCANGKCIRRALVCDGEYNCEDHSDEAECRPHCRDDQFKCNENGTVCLDHKFVCDADLDCPGGEDEASCSCPTGEFQCDNGLCVAKEWVCDGINDCLDGSDEVVGQCKGQCRGRSFKCKNKRCVRQAVVCNGVDDCGDGSDEAATACIKCPEGRFKCEREQLCVHNGTKCDGVFDCPDGSDEIQCPKPVCSFGSCSQICLEKKGKFNCICAAGYAKGGARNDTCVAQDSKQTLLITSDSGLRSLNPSRHDEGSKALQVLERAKIDDFDYLLIDERTVTLFWIDTHSKALQRARISWVTSEKLRKIRGAEGVKILDTGLKHPISVAVDYVGENLYIMDADTEAIYVTDFEGRRRMKIVHTGRQPSDMIIDQENRNLIWSTRGRVIMASSLDGSNRRAFYTQDVEWASDFAIDNPTSRLYWVDQRKSTIESTHLNGTDPRLILQLPELAKPQRLDIFEDYLYVVLRNQSIIRVHKFGQGKPMPILESFHRAYSVSVVHPLKQNFGENETNPCRASPCSETAVCLLSSATAIGRTCNCPDKLLKFIENGEVVCHPKAEEPGSCSLHCNSGKCIFVDGDPRCDCPPQYEGERCEHYTCNGFCHNSGKCFFNFSIANDGQPIVERKCNCPPNWTGPRCETSVELCKSRCHNGGTCLFVEEGIEKCSCPSEYAGERCEHCADLRCENGAVCRKTPQGASQCACPDGYHFFKFLKLFKVAFQCVAIESPICRHCVANMLHLHRLVSFVRYQLIW